jgi:hypothetical protein
VGIVMPSESPCQRCSCPGAAPRRSSPPHPTSPQDLPERVRASLEDPASSYNNGWSHGKETLQNGRRDTFKGSFYANPAHDEVRCAAARGAGVGWAGPGGRRGRWARRRWLRRGRQGRARPAARCVQARCARRGAAWPPPRRRGPAARWRWPRRRALQR